MCDKFKYDAFTLIELVETRTCLWDKTLEVYSNKVARKNAWREIAIFFECDFEDYEENKKEEIKKVIVNKWNNIRDTFIKSLKTKSGQGVKKKYLYSDNLQFLLKTVTPDETISNIPARTYDCLETDDCFKPVESNSRSSTSVESRKRKLNPVDQEIIKALKESDTKQSKEDDDLSFLHSILPQMKKVNENDKLDFRIEVMQLLQKYVKRNHNNSNSVSAACAGTSSGCHDIESPASSPLHTVIEIVESRYDDDYNVSD